MRRVNFSSASFCAMIFWRRRRFFSASATASRSDSSAASEALKFSARVTASGSAASFVPSNFSVNSSSVASPRAARRQRWRGCAVQFRLQQAGGRGGFAELRRKLRVGVADFSCRHVGKRGAEERIRILDRAARYRTVFRASSVIPCPPVVETHSGRSTPATAIAAMPSSRADEKRSAHSSSPHVRFVFRNAERGGDVFSFIPAMCGINLRRLRDDRGVHVHDFPLRRKPAWPASCRKVAGARLPAWVLREKMADVRLAKRAQRGRRRWHAGARPHPNGRRGPLGAGFQRRQDRPAPGNHLMNIITNANVEPCPV